MGSLKGGGGLGRRGKKRHDEMRGVFPCKFFHEEPYMSFKRRYSSEEGCPPLLLLFFFPPSKDPKWGSTKPVRSLSLLRSQS